MRSLGAVAFAASLTLVAACSTTQVPSKTHIDDVDVTVRMADDVTSSGRFVRPESAAQFKKALLRELAGIDSADRPLHIEVTLRDASRGIASRRSYSSPSQTAIEAPPAGEASAVSAGGRVVIPQPSGNQSRSAGTLDSGRVNEPYPITAWLVVDYTLTVIDGQKVKGSFIAEGPDLVSYSDIEFEQRKVLRSAAMQLRQQIQRYHNS